MHTTDVCYNTSEAPLLREDGTVIAGAVRVGVSLCACTRLPSVNGVAMGINEKGQKS